MIFRIPVEIYNTSVHVILNESDEKAVRYYNRFGGEFSFGVPLEEGTIARAICDVSGLTFVRFRKDPSAATVAHEFLHCVLYILNNRGLSVSSESEEAYCYLLSYLVDQFERKTRPRT